MTVRRLKDREGWLKDCLAEKVSERSEGKHGTDWAKMAQVLEYLTPEERGEAFKPEHTINVPERIVPEHEETIPAKWAVKGTVMKLLRRHGDEAVAVAEAATFDGKTFSIA